MKPRFLGYKVNTVLTVAILFLLGIFLGWFFSVFKNRSYTAHKTYENTNYKKTPPATQNCKVPVFLYHYVENPSNPDDTIRKSLTVTPYFFETQIKTLLDEGFSIVTPQDIYFCVMGKKDLGNKSVVITFDDGFGDFYTDAYPLIKKYNIPVTVFIPSGLIGKPNYMNYEQVKEIIGEGLVEFGLHGWSHKNLTQIDEKSRYEEIVLGKKYFEDTYGVSLKYFAYPYGSFDATVEKEVKNAGFMLAFSVVGDGGHTHSPQTLFHLSRVKIGNVGKEYLLDFLSKF